MGLFIAEAVQASNPYLDRIELVQGNIAAQEMDAVVTLLPQTLEYRGSVNKAIQRCAGQGMDKFLRQNVVNPQVGDVYAVPGFEMGCRNVFFAIVPVWKDEWDRHDRQLLNATRKAMELARRMSLRSIAFPPIGSGQKGFPKERAARLILQGITDRLDDDFEKVRIVCQRPETMQIFEKRLRRSF